MRNQSTPILHASGGWLTTSCHGLGLCFSRGWRCRQDGSEEGEGEGEWDGMGVISDFWDLNSLKEIVKIWDQQLLFVLFSGQLEGKKAPPLPTQWLRSLLQHFLYQWMRKVSFCSIHLNIHLICFHIDDKYYPPRTFLSSLFPLKKNTRFI